MTWHTTRTTCMWQVDLRAALRLYTPGWGVGAQAHLVPCRTSQRGTIVVSRGVVWCFMGERVRMAKVLWTEGIRRDKREKEHKRWKGSWTLDHQQHLGKLALHVVWAAQLRSPCWWSFPSSSSSMICWSTWRTLTFRPRATGSPQHWETQDIKNDPNGCPMLIG